MPQQSRTPEILDPSDNTPTQTEEGPPDYLTTTTTQDTPEYPTYYFFYGILTRPPTLKRILDIPATAPDPVLRKAQITGYRLAKWGDYPALIEGDSKDMGQVVMGYAYLVKGEDEAGKLAYYETSAYRVVDCLVRFVDGEMEGEVVEGRTFIYAGDTTSLLEQRFDRKL